MAASTGLFSFLRDKSASWENKVKIVRYAWATETVYTQNKYQNLIDWLCTTLTNKKKSKISESDELRLWQCLSDVLQSKKLRQYETKGRSIFVKTSFAHVIIEALTSSQPIQRLGLEVVRSVITSPLLCHIFTARYETLVQLVGNSIQVCLATEDDHCDTVDVILTKFTSAQRQNNNQKMVTNLLSEKLLIPAIQLVQLKKGEPKWQRVVARLNVIISNGLFQREHGQTYEAFLNQMAVGVVDKSQVPKLPEHVFSAITRGLTPDGTDKGANRCQAVASYLLDLFSAFQRAFHNRSEDGATHFKFLCHLFTILGITGESSTLILPAQATLEVVHSLLEATIEGDVYDVGADNSKGFVQLKWFRMLVEKLLALNNSDCPAWYNCFTSLLALNHEILVPNMTEIWTKAWLTTAEISGDVLNAQNNLFASWLRVYIALRQVQKIVAKVLQLLKETDASDLMWPEKFLEVFGNSVPNLPTGQVLSLWSDLIEEINSSYLESESSAKNLRLVSILFNVFLVNVKMADYNIATVTADKINELMTKTRDRVLLPMESKIIEKDTDKDSVASYLLLSTSFRDLQLLMKLYAKNKQSQELMELFEINRVILPDSHIVSYFSMLQFISGVRNNQLLQLTDKSVEDTVDKQMKDVFAVLLPAKDEHTCTWDGKDYTISSANVHVALWSCLTKHLPLLVNYVQEETLHEVLHVVIRHSVVGADDSSGGSLGSVFYNFLQSSAFHECRRLQTALVAVFTSNVRSVFSIDRPEKTHHKKILKFVQTAPPGGPVKEEFGKLFEGFLANAESLSTVPSDSKSNLAQFIQVLSWQPLEFYHPREKLLCVVGLLQVLLGTNKHGSICLDLTTIGFQVLHALLTDGTSAIASTGAEQLCAKLYHLGRTCGVLSEDGKKFLGVYKDLVSVCVKNHLKEARVHGSYLVPFIEQVVGDVLQETAENSYVLSLETLTILLQAAHKVIRNDLAPPDVKTAYHKQFVRLECLAVKLYTEDATSSRLPHQLWDICGTLLSYHWRSDEPSQLMANLKTLLVVVLNHIRIENNLPHIEACIGFIITVTKCFKSSTKPPVEGIDLENVLDVSMESLVEFLSQLNKKKYDKMTEGHEIKKTEQDKTKSFEKLDPEESMDWEQSDLPSKTSRTSTKLLGSSVPCDRNELFNGEDVRRVEELTQDAIGLMLSACGVEQFTTMLHETIKDMSPDHIWTDASKVSTGITIWRRLLSVEVNKEKITNLSYASQSVIICFQSLLLELKMMTEIDDYIIQNVLEPLLAVETAILTHSQLVLRIPSNVAIMVLNSCEFAPLHTKMSHKNFMRVFPALYHILNVILLKHTHSCLSVIPSFQSAAKRLLEAVVLRSNQGEDNMNNVEDLVHCAGLIERLFSLMATHKEDFSKVALYLVAEYVTSVQKVTLIPAVKKSLLPGIHLLLNLCDEHATAVLHTVLNPGVKHIFSTLYQDYTKHYKYTGRI